MKSIVQAPVYYATTPLRAVTPVAEKKQSLSQQSPYLRRVLAGNRQTVSRGRVLPIDQSVLPKPGIMMSRLHRSNGKAEMKEKEWFNNYE